MYIDKITLQISYIVYPTLVDLLVNVLCLIIIVVGAVICFIFLTE